MLLKLGMNHAAISRDIARSCVLLRAALTFPILAAPKAWINAQSKPRALKKVRPPVFASLLGVGCLAVADSRLQRPYSRLLSVSCLSTPNLSSSKFHIAFGPLLSTRPALDRLTRLLLHSNHHFLTN